MDVCSGWVVGFVGGVVGDVTDLWQTCGVHVAYLLQTFDRPVVDM